jgi:iron complex transport system permease protein
MRAKSSSFKIFILVALVVLLSIATVTATALGAVAVPLRQVIAIVIGAVPGFKAITNLADISQTTQAIIFEVRLPRVLLSLVVGASLAVSGVIFQGIFSNSLADPYIIGISSGAALGATLALMLGIGASLFGLFAVPSMAFIGAISTVLIVYNLARRHGQISVSSLLLSGIAVGAFFSALTSLLMVTGSQDLQAAIYWLMGGLSARGWQYLFIALPFLILGLPVALLFSRDLNILVLGDERASQLGVNVEFSKNILIFSASLMTAAAVSVSGLIGFVGLIVPHLVRLVIGADHRFLIIGSALLGALFLVLADSISRTIIAPTEIPVGITTAMFGAPFFLYLLRSQKSGVY